MVKTQKDWAIRSKASNLAMVEHDDYSEILRLRFTNDSLANLMWNKIRSAPFGNFGE